MTLGSILSLEASPSTSCLLLCVRADDVSGAKRPTQLVEATRISSYAAMAEKGRTSRSRSTEPPVLKTYSSSAHFRNLLDGLQALREGGILYDVVLVVEGRRIQAHRILLAASCDYFR